MCSDWAARLLVSSDDGQRARKSRGFCRLVPHRLDCAMPRASREDDEARRCLRT
jgi:hypothetical protein